MSETGEIKALVPKLRFPEFSTHGAPIVELRKIARYVSDSVKLSHVNPASYVSTESLLPEFAGFDKPAGLPNVTSVKSFTRNDVLVSNIRPYLKKVWYADRDGGASNDILVFRTDGAARPDYLAQVIRSERFIGHMMKSAKGVKMPRGDAEDALAFKVMCPSDAEQRKIAECLQSLDELIAAETEKLEALKRHKKGLLQQLFPAEGETIPRLRFPQFRNSAEWVPSPLEGVLTESFYGTSKATSGTGTYPVLRMGNMQGGCLRLDNLAYIDLTNTEFVSLRLIQGDLLLNRTNSIDLVGRVSIFELQDNFVCASYIVVLRPDQSKVDPRFCNYFLNTDASQSQIRSMATHAVSQANINPSRFRKEFVIALPTLEEQRVIESCMTVADDAINSLSHEVTRLRRHKAALMQQLFPSLDEVDAPIA